MKKGDWWILAAVTVAAALLWLWPRGDQSAAAVTVTTPAEEFTLPLNRDTTLTLTGQNGIAVTIEVTDGAVRFAHSDCPDKVCVHSGWLSRPGAGAACVPAGVLLRLEADGEVDAVAG